MNILWISNSISGRYGYSVVSGPITEGMQKAGHQMFVMGMQSVHPPFKDEIGRVHLGIRYDSFGSDILSNYIKMYKIDCLITMFDVWIQQAQYIPNVVREHNIPWICHVTINSSPLSIFLKQPLSQADYLVAPSKYNAQEMLNAGLGSISYNISHIPHPVDLNIYKKLKREEDENIIFLSVMRNKGYQKNFPALFHAYKIFIENFKDAKENTRLMILADPYEPEGMRLDLLRDSWGLKDYIKFINVKPSEDLRTIESTSENDNESIAHNANLNFSPEEMCKIYNTADIHISSSQGESFSLPTLESMACGIPQIFTNCSTGPELVGEPKTGLLADIQNTLTTPMISDVWMVNPYSLAECMQKLWSDKKLRNECSKNALKFVKNYSTDKIIKAWLKLLEIVEKKEMTVDFNKQKLGV